MMCICTTEQRVIYKDVNFLEISSSNLTNIAARFETSKQSTTTIDENQSKEVQCSRSKKKHINLSNEINLFYGPLLFVTVNNF